MAIFTHWQTTALVLEVVTKIKRKYTLAQTHLRSKLRVKISVKHILK